MTSPPVAQQLDGLEMDTGAGDHDTPAPAFHLAKLFPIIAWTAFRCRACNAFVAQVDAEPYPNPPGWQHRQGECPK